MIKLTGMARPLWVDTSANNGSLNLRPFAAQESATNQVHGIIARSSISWRYKDPQFQSTLKQAREIGLYNTSYHVPYYNQPIGPQLDNWYAAHPGPDPKNPIPRVLDVELSQGQPASVIAAKTWEICREVKARDGMYPIIYSRYMLMEKWFASWSSRQWNSLFYFLARYRWNRALEHPGPPIPVTKLPQLLRSRVLLHQTADKKSPPVPGVQNLVDAKHMDYDRWELGNEGDMRHFITTEWGTTSPPAPNLTPEEQLTILWEMRHEHG